MVIKSTNNTTFAILLVIVATVFSLSVTAAAQKRTLIDIGLTAASKLPDLDGEAEEAVTYIQSNLNTIPYKIQTAIAKIPSSIKSKVAKIELAFKNLHGEIEAETGGNEVSVLKANLIAAIEEVQELIVGRRHEFGEVVKSIVGKGKQVVREEVRHYTVPLF